MAKFEVILLGQAEKFYKKASDNLIHRLNTCFYNLELNPYQGPNIKLLRTKKSIKWFRYRIGDYRVVYEINPTNNTVGILLILHRSTVYKGI